MSAGMSEPRRSCKQCRWCYAQDEGWSSYTVEGETVYCLKNLHPSGPEGFDSWFGEDTRLNYATQCPGFTEGEHVHVDVDRDEAPYGTKDWWNYYTDDEEQRALMAAFLRGDDEGTEQ